MSSAWLVVAIPGTVLFLAAILALSALVEQHFLSPRSMILGVVRARHNTPEYTEAFVARQFDLLLLSPRNQRFLSEPVPSQSEVARRASTVGAPGDR